MYDVHVLSCRLTPMNNAKLVMVFKYDASVQQLLFPNFCVQDIGFSRARRIAKSLVRD